MKRYIIYILSLSFVVACDKFDDEILPNYGALTNEVAMTLNIGVNSITGDVEELPSITTRSDETSDTESITDPAISLIDNISSQVMNLWVVQFNGTSDSSKVISTSYIDTSSDLVGTNQSINLIETSQPATILFFANTFNDNLVSSLNYTLAEVKALSYSVATNLEDTNDPDSEQLSYGNGLTTKGEDGTEYFTMSYAIDRQILGSEADNSELKIKLLRNAVKIIITLSNEWSGAEITSISLRDISDKCYYYSSYLADDSYIGNDNPFPLTSNPVDYQSTPLNIAAQHNQTITLYAPANVKGINPLSTLQSKSYYAPATSTYMYIQADYDEAYEYSYTYYLGANLIDDYNLRPNHAYTYSLNFKSGGTADTDYSIDLDLVDYTSREASNCYILNPPASNDIVYYIPIKNRINEFWSSYATPTQSDRLNDNTDWDYAVLWYDNDDDPICPAVWEDGVDISTPTTSQVKIERVEKHTNDLPALKVTLPKGFDNDGNIVVAVYDKGDNSLTPDGYHAKSALNGDILWSWHLWITDYNPDSRQHTPITDEYRYSVDGGEIHRYIDNTRPDNLSDDEEKAQAILHTYYTTLWGEGGVYSNSFIMDRNLGARGSSYLEQGSGTNGGSDATSRYYVPGALYYQAGRKDPFIANHGKFLTGVDDEGNFIYEYEAISTGNKRKETAALSSDKAACNVKFSDAVLRPTVFFYSTDNSSKNNWTDENDANNLDYLWNDKNVANSTDTYFDVTAKSIFDPSPVGWRMPIRGTWDNFNCDPTKILPVAPYVTYDAISNSNYSREYLLCGAQYPGASGIMVSGSFFKTAFFETFSWSATPYDKYKELGGEETNAFYSSYLGAYDAGIYPQGASWHFRQIGMPVRPVKCQ